MKRVFSFLIAIIVTISISYNVQALRADSIRPQYANARQAEVLLSISSSGKAVVVVKCYGTNGLKSVYVTTYLEKKVSGTWIRVNIPAPNNTWTYSTTSQSFSQEYIVALDSVGQYRATSQFVLTAATVEYITDTSYATYKS
jgi:hypothetical protein